MAGEDEREFVIAEGSVLVGEPDPAVELWVARQPFLDAGHADQEQPVAAPVEAVAQVLQRGRGEPFGLVDDEELDPVGRGGVADRWFTASDVLVDAGLDAAGEQGQVVVELAQGRGGAGRVEHGARPCERGVDRGVAVVARSPLLEESFGGVPVCVAAR